MGYYTNYTLSDETPEDWSKEIETFLLDCKSKGIKLPKGFNAFDHSPYFELESALAEEVSGYKLEDFLSGSDQTKWYTHEEDIKKFSKRFPTVLFTLKGEGEESGDMWFKYFKNGKMQVAMARIEFDSFNEGKLV